MTRIALGLEYDGTAYRGFQRQSTLDTVQEALERALSRIADHPIKVTCAGRTDAGVHALEQVVHFDTAAVRSPRAWVEGTNSHLPQDIAVRWISGVPETFHARFSAIRRHYRYCLNTRAQSSVFGRDQVTHWPYALDVSLMQEASKCLIGEHDFRSFSGPDDQSRSTVRRVDAIEFKNGIPAFAWITGEASVEFSGEKGMDLAIDMVANAFLHHMVRKIVGVLLQIGGKRRPVEAMAALLEGRDRRLIPELAPAHGLYLMAVEYPISLPYDLR